MRRFISLIPRHDAISVPYPADRRDWIRGTWYPAGDAVRRAENDLLEAMDARGVAGIVADGKLYVDTGACPETDAMLEHIGTGMVVVDLADVPDLAVPAPDDDRTSLLVWVASQASHYRSLGTDAAELVADTLADLAREIRSFSTPGRAGRRRVPRRREAMARFISTREAEIEMEGGVL